MDEIAQKLGRVVTAEDCIALAETCCSNSKGRKQLMTILASGEKKMADKAAWCLGQMANLCPEKVSLLLPELIPLLAKPGISEPIKRNILRMCREVPVPASCHGPLMQSCFEVLLNNAIGSAPKAFALHVLSDMCHMYPDLLAEVTLIIEDRWPIEKPAFKSAARKLLLRFDKKKKR